jgi:hypothetical protein
LSVADIDLLNYIEGDLDLNQSNDLFPLLQDVNQDPHLGVAVHLQKPVKQEPDYNKGLCFSTAQPAAGSGDLSSTQALKSLLELHEMKEDVKQETSMDAFTNGGIVMDQMPAGTVAESDLSGVSLKGLLTNANDVTQAALQLQQQLIKAKQQRQLQQLRQFILLQQQRQQQQQQQQQQQLVTVTQATPIQNTGVAAASSPGQRQLKLILQQPLTTIGPAPVTAVQQVSQVTTSPAAQVQVVNSQPVQVTSSPAPAAVPTNQVSLQQLQQVSLFNSFFVCFFPEVYSDM